LQVRQWLCRYFGELAEGQPLPLPGIAPMAQEYFLGLALASATLEQTLLKMDLILPGEEGGG